MWRRQAQRATTGAWLSEQVSSLVLPRLEQIGRLGLDAVRLKVQSGPAASAWRSYLAACIGHGRTPPTPVTADKLCGHVVTMFLNGLSPDTVSNYVSGVIKYAVTESLLQGVVDAVRAQVSGLRRVLETEFPGEKQRVLPLLDAELLQVHAYLRKFLDRGDLWAMGWWAMLLVMRDCCLRSNEALGGALTGRQLTRVQLSDGLPTIVLDVAFSKTHKAMRDREKDCVVISRRPKAPTLDAYRALDAYLVRCSLPVGPTGASTSVFPERFKTSGARRFPMTGDYPYQNALDDLRWLLGEAGVSRPLQYGLHSPRRGGATRYLAMGVRWDIVKRLGRWATDEALREYDARYLELAEAVTSLNDP